MVAGIYGLLVLVPQYFLEEKTGRDYPPAISHPEFYYGFIGVAVAWQIAFLMISREPQRHRPIIIASVVEKYSYGIAVITLYTLDRVGALILSTAIVDIFLGTMFLRAYRKLISARTV